VGRRDAPVEPSTIRVVLVGHFLTADIGRLFGRPFYDSISRPETGPPLGLRDSKLIGFRHVGPHGAFASPVVEYAAGPDGSLFAVVLETRDTNLPFARGKLEELSQAYLGLGKAGGLTDDDKRDMRRTFRTKTGRAYGYAAADAVNALLVYERMNELDREVQASLSTTGREPAPMRPTAGGRVAASIVAMTHEAAAGSQELRGESSLRALMRRGVEAFDESRFGRQTGSVHGGLNFSRSPTRLWHEAKGMIRDVDMSGCYNTIIAGLDVYWGRPIVHEPGSRALTLRQAVELVRRHAAPGGWYIRVTGDIAEGHNVLIPSTIGATTSANYRRRRRRRPDAEPAGARLYSARIESGVVTDATWLVISALPEALGEQYAGLTAESIVFYPRELTAQDGPSFDRLVARHRAEGLPWEAVLEMDELRQRIVERFDADHVALKFPIRDLARRVGELRREARTAHGKGGGLDLAWKIQANTMYGVLASPSMATGNPVAANVITASARAAAFGLMLALNGIQVVTDGCTYRRDQIPACTLAECLSIQPDYPLRRAEDGSGIPFLDPEEVPVDDDAFKAWFVAHALRFFGVAGEDYRALFSIHTLAHKAAGGSPASDALACDGGANYAHCRRGADGWEVSEMKMRGYGRESKRALSEWIISTFSSDTLEDLPPPASDSVLLGASEAQATAGRALRRGMPEAIVPLGFEARKTRAYRAIRLSAFVCRTPAQFDALTAQFERFNERNACGLEGLALRRPYNGRRAGSVSAVAESIYDRIRDGTHDLTKSLHLGRPIAALTSASERRREGLEAMRREAARGLLEQMDPGSCGADEFPVGIVLTRAGESGERSSGGTAG
jgi:hypothetical protein